MTHIENERRKRELWCYAHVGVGRVIERYPQVERIEILYEEKHISFVGPSCQKGCLGYTPQDECVFIIPCLNAECSTIGFDLANTISSAIHNHQTEVSGKMACEGQEAPDHPNQRCSGTIEYTVKVKYW